MNTKQARIDMSALLGGNQAAMSPFDIGVAFLLAKYMMDSGHESISESVARVVAAGTSRGNSGADPMESVGFLCEIGVLRFEDGKISVPSLKNMIERREHKRQAMLLAWERRREGKVAEHSGSRSRGRKKASLPADDSRIVCNIICKNGTYPVTENWISEKEKIYQGIDIKREVSMAAEWSMNNPQKRKTLGGVNRFLMTWLNNARSREIIRKDVVGAINNNRSGGFGLGGKQEMASGQQNLLSGNDGVEDLAGFVPGNGVDESHPKASLHNFFK